MNGSSGYFKPALISGAAFGVASGIPLLNCANLFCCALAIGGGLLASFLYLKNAPPQAAPYGEAAVLGALTGIIGAVIAAIVALPINLMGFAASGGGFEQLKEQLGDQDIPPQVQNLLDMLAAGGTGIGAIVFGFLINAVLFTLFAAVGAMIGAAIFAKKG